MIRRLLCGSTAIVLALGLASPGAAQSIVRSVQPMPAGCFPGPSDAQLRACLAVANDTKPLIAYTASGLYTFTGTMPIYQNVYVECVPGMVQPTPGSQSQVDSWQPITGANKGTWFQGDGTFDAFAAQVTPTGTPPTSNAFANQLINRSSWNHCGFDNFTTGIHAGATNVAGLAWAHITDNFFHHVNAAWIITNGAYNYYYDNQIAISGGANGTATLAYCAINRSDIAPTIYESENGRAYNNFCSVPVGLASAGFWLDATKDTWGQSGMNDFVYMANQVDGGGPAPVSFSETANSTVNWPVADLTQLAVGARIKQTATGNGLTAGIDYYVTQVSGASGSGTVQLANCRTCGASPITATASTAQTWTTERPAGFRVGGSGGFVEDSSGLEWDIEGNGGIEVDSALHLRVTTNKLNLSAAHVVDRNSGNGNEYHLGNEATILDISGGTQYQLSGSVNTPLNTTPSGYFYDKTESMYRFGIASTSLGGRGAEVDVHQQGGNNEYWSPNIGLGQAMLSTGSFNFTLGMGQCGKLILTGSGGFTSTYTLPAIGSTTAGSKINNFNGCPFDVISVGGSPGAYTFPTTGGQTLNNVAGLTSVQLPTHGGLRFTGYATGGYWLAEIVNYLGQPTYDFNAGAIQTPAATGSTVTIADGVDYVGIKPSGNVTSVTIQLGTCSTTYPNSVQRFKNISTFSISGITYTTTAGSAGGDLPTSLASGVEVTARCDGSSATWF